MVLQVLKINPLSQVSRLIETKYLLAQSAMIPPSFDVNNLVGLARMSSNPVVFS
jgi:hypothetical protein